MLFLLNDRVLDLGDPAETLLESGAGDPARLPPLHAIITRGQEAAFASSAFAAAHPDLRRSIASMIVLSSTANCALFVCPPRARAARDVAVRFAFAPLTTLAFLADAQRGGRAVAALANAHVWRLARTARTA